MPNVACRLRAKLVISSEFSIVGNCFYCNLILSKDMLLLLYLSNFTELLVLLHSVELNVGNPNNQSMMNFVFHLPVLSMDPD